MTLKLNDKFVRDFVSVEELSNMQPMVNTAHQMLLDHSGRAAISWAGWTFPLPMTVQNLTPFWQQLRKLRKAAIFLS